MKVFKSFVLKWCVTIASLALTLGVASSDAVCFWWWHQPKVPQGMEKFKK